MLVHGAWHGGWCWARVAPLLAACGFDVHTPTLTGLGDRSHLVSPAITLSTHVDDVVLAVERGGMDDVVLVGHSYAGFVVREAADRLGGRVGAVALIDAWVGDDGTSVASQAPAWFTESLHRSARTSATAWLCPPPSPELVGVTDPDDARWLRRNLVAHPLRTFEDRTRLTGRVDRIPHRAAVCSDGIGLPFADMAAAVGCAAPTEIASGHDAMVVAPEAVADFIAEAATD
ncbi:MAG: alpha/beta hydrolase [Acidimicrobiales bacterium]|nr:alpha/beta hydrolase [Acidimicrobiales bacterium]